MSNINELLKEKREKKGFSLREAARRSGLSHSYIDSLEKGFHPTTKTPIKPSPITLKSLSEAYNCDYIELMHTAGYIENEKERELYTLQDSAIENIIKETESEFNVNLRDDPLVESMVRDVLRSLAQMKQRK